MNEWSIIAVASILAMAGVLELLSVKDKTLLYPKLMALGFFMLSTRLFYLVETHDIGRLNIWGTGPIAMLGVARVYYCAMVMRGRL